METWRRDLSTEEFEDRCREAIDLGLRQAISERLVLQEARDGLSDKEKEDVDAELAATLKDRAAEAGGLVQLESRLRAAGSTLEKEKADLRDRLIVQRFLRQKFGGPIAVSPSELLEHYNRVRAERYERPLQAHLRLILIKKAESASPEQAGALAAAVRDRAAGGEDFARLARQYSHDPMAAQGGDWGLVTRGAFRVKAVDEALFGLAAGQVSPVVETDEEFYVVRCDERREAGAVPLAEVQATLEGELRQRKYNEIVSKYIQELYQRAYVHVILENL
jgi:parvulin-like peptidyl-prolyl isomerase